MASSKFQTLRQPFSRLFAHFRAFHEAEPFRLQYMGWFGAAGFFMMYFVRFMRPHYELFDDMALRAPAVVLLALLGARDYWPARMKRYYFLFAWWVVMLVLPFALTYFCLERAAGLTSVTNFFILLAFLGMMTEWRNMLSMLAVGMSLAILVYWVTHPVREVPHAMLRQVPAFLLILVGSIVIQRRVLSKLLETEARIQALRDSVGFLAHELNTPLATVRSYLSVLRSAHTDSSDGVAKFNEKRPGSLVTAIENAERGALYCQALVSAFAQSARRVSPDNQSQVVKAHELMLALLREYPFNSRQKEWVRLTVTGDFELPGRDLLYLVISAVIQNALDALAHTQRPTLQITIGAEDGPNIKRVITFTDNGPGIPSETLALLTHRQVSTRGSEHGMGLLLASRVMLALAGSIKIDSAVGAGTTVSLFFDFKDQEISQASDHESAAPTRVWSVQETAS